MATAAGHQRSTDRRYYGVVEALVVDNDDPGQEGRVKVQFPWLDDTMVSDWCRVSQLYAGAGYGALWTPEIRDEVLVSFIHGDLRQPIILGGLYNGPDKPATYRAKDKDEKLLRTKAGHQMLFVDTAGAQRIVIVDKSTKHQIEISTQDGAIRITSSGGKITLSAKEIEILADDSLTVQAKSISENAQSKFELQAGTIDAAAKGKMTLQGATIDLN